jgi:hypothetical protein
VEKESASSSSANELKKKSKQPTRQLCKVPNAQMVIPPNGGQLLQSSQFLFV